MKKHRYISRILVAILCMVAIFSNIDVQANTEAINKISQEEGKKIEEFILNQIKEGKIPGMSISIVQGNETIYEKGFGYANLDTKEEVTRETLFELGSNSKAFTALGILKLEEKGLLNLSDPIKKYIPWLDMSFNGENVDVTIEQFMEHTSGVPFSSISNIPISKETNALETTVKTLQNIKLESKPGTNFRYATINYDVLGLVIQEVSEMSYEEFMKSEVIDTLGLDNTYLSRENIEDKMSLGYKRYFFKAKEYKAPIYRGNVPAGYIISNASDMSKWMKAQLIDEKDIQEEYEIIKKSHETGNARENGAIYSSGWNLNENNTGLLYHGGNNPNYASYIILDKEENMGIAILGNIESAYVSNIAWGIFDILNGEEPYSYKVSDSNKVVDLVATIVIGIMVILSIFLVSVIVKFILGVIKKKVSINKITYKGVVAFIVSMSFMVFIMYCIYLIPKAFAGIANWNFIFVWFPETLKLAIGITILNVWIIYFIFILRALFKNESQKSLFELIVLSVISGYGNSLIILSINLAIGRNTSSIDIIVYFVLGIVLYVYGQRLVRVNLIKYTNNMVYKKRIELVNKLLKSSFDEYEKVENGRIHATLNNDTERVSAFANILIGGVTSMITVIFTSMYLAIISWQGLILSLAIIISIASIYFAVGRYANKMWEECRDIQNIFFRFINDLTIGFKELALNINKKNEFEKDMDDVCEKYKNKLSKAEMAFANMFVVGELLFTLAIGGVVFIFPLVLKGLEQNTLSTYVFILLYMTGPVHGVLNVIPQIFQVRVSWKRINDLLTEVECIGKNDLKEEELRVVEKANLELNQLEYEYNHKDGEKSFKVGPINYEFKHGEIVFITGGNGSGKSTLAKLITGLYKPTSGKITVNGEYIQNKVISEHYSAVFSDFHLFSKLYGIDCNEKRAEIDKYLNILEMKEKVEVKGNEFTTVNLSTGQKKRLALLITYLEDKPIYLFDEWAADQDPDFRKFFYRELLPNLKARGKCVIAITHDDNYFDMCDKSIKMDMGQLIEQINI